MELTVNAKPMSFMKVLKFDTKDLIHVYKGKLDNCRCGCGGDYFKPGTKHEDAEIQRALDLLLKYASRGEVLFEKFSYKDSAKNELYFEFETHITTNYDNGFDEDDDYDWYEENRMGYGIYIKDTKE